MSAVIKASRFGLAGRWSKNLVPLARFLHGCSSSAKPHRRGGRLARRGGHESLEDQDGQDLTWACVCASVLAAKRWCVTIRHKTMSRVVGLNGAFGN